MGIMTWSVWTLATVSLVLSATLTSLKPRFGDSMPVMNVHWKGTCLQGSFRATWIGNRLHMLPRRLSAATQMHLKDEKAFNFEEHTCHILWFSSFPAV